MKNYININSMLYSSLFKVGGDDLIAAYSILKFGKKGKIKIFKEQNRPIYHTLKTETNLSISTLRKYIKILIKLNLCCFDRKGNFCMTGNNKINKLYGKKKVVPIEIGTLTQTKLFSFRVRIFRMEQLQKSKIDRRSDQNNIMWKIDKGYRLTDNQMKFKTSWSDSDWACAENKNTYTGNTVLSNQGYSKLKAGYLRSKSSGKYWKTKLVKSGIIKTRRKFKFIKKSSKSEYLVLRNAGYNKLVLKNGKLYEELPSEFTTTEFIKPAKRPATEGFDFLEFLKAI